MEASENRLDPIMEALEPFNSMPKPYRLTFLIHMKWYIIFVEKYISILSVLAA
jgi:hypothetical protein